MWLLQLFLFVAAHAHTSINRISISNQLPPPHCRLQLTNTQEIVDISTNCPLSTTDQYQVQHSLLNLIKLNASYLIREQSTVLGYRYFKDTNNYKFKEYDFNRYHQAIENTTRDLQLSPLTLPFEERYELTLNYYIAEKQWKLSSLLINYTNLINEDVQLENYEVRSWMQEKKSERSIALRKLGGKGPNQAINITLELAIEDEAKIKADQCKVVIQQILPEWFFVDYDFLHTLVKYEVFDIELPEHFSKQYFFKYTIPFSRFKKTAPHSFAYQYKIGVRYPRPTNDGSYFVQVGLHPNDRITIECQGQTPIEVVEDLLNDRGHGTMFAGREQDAKRVTMITYLVTTVLSVLAIKAVRVPKQLK